jgi:hypothetical protein
MERLFEGARPRVSKHSGLMIGEQSSRLVHDNCAAILKRDESFGKNESPKGRGRGLQGKRGELVKGRNGRKK